MADVLTAEAVEGELSRLTGCGVTHRDFRPARRIDEIPGGAR